MALVTDPADLPQVLNGGPVDQDWFNSVRALLIEQDESDVSFEATNNSSNATTTGTEAFSVTKTVDLVSTGTYKVTWTGVMQSSVAGDLVIFRLRYKAGASVDSAGTQMRINTGRSDTAGFAASGPLTMVAKVTGLSGQHTFGASINRSAGTGTCQINGAAGDESYLLVERIS